MVDSEHLIDDATGKKRKKKKKKKREDGAEGDDHESAVQPEKTSGTIGPLKSHVPSQPPPAARKSIGGLRKTPKFHDVHHHDHHHHHHHEHVDAKNMAQVNANKAKKDKDPNIWNMQEADERQRIRYD